jgi:hypothetical protein
MARKPKEKIDIDVVPYLSIMVIVLKLICLILIVTVMRIALNPRQLRVVSFEGLYQGAAAKLPTPGKDQHGSGLARVVKVPSYVECSENGVGLFPGEVKLSLNDLMQPGNQLEKLLDDVVADTSNQYVIVLMRPRSGKVYRYVRRMVAERPIDVGYDVLDEDAKIDWRKEAKSLNIILPKS